MPFKINRPQPGGGDRWDKAGHLDHLHLFIANDGFKAEEVDTANGPAQAVKVDFIVCTADNELWDDQLVFGAALVPQLGRRRTRCHPRPARPSKGRAWQEPGVDVGRPYRRRHRTGRTVPREVRHHSRFGGDRPRRTRAHRGQGEAGGGGRSAVIATPIPTDVAGSRLCKRRSESCARLGSWPRSSTARSRSALWRTWPATSPAASANSSAPTAAPCSSTPPPSTSPDP